ncbi:hypothetical protein BpHYR1_031296 [Brachionus plicatilis]|uniref:Uncharacterized protein n=1 Tax=Brachionus plicatilis TaxID=10195 RepID=A0A3M7T6R3_BRAPC|nr:hypothetical protein BpHYR1_031296 [Brachionus plicatilis]
MIMRINFFKFILVLTFNILLTVIWAFFYFKLTLVENDINISALETHELFFIPIFKFISIIFIFLALMILYDTFFLSKTEIFIKSNVMIYLSFGILIMAWIYWIYFNEPNFSLIQTQIYSKEFSMKNTNEIRLELNQNFFKCCGWFGPEDYLNSTQGFSMVPRSCCVSKVRCDYLDDLVKTGCQQPITSFLELNSSFLRYIFSIILSLNVLIAILNVLVSFGIKPTFTENIVGIQIIDEEEKPSIQQSIKY